MQSLRVRRGNSLLLTYSTGAFPVDNIPNTCDPFAASVTVSCSKWICSLSLHCLRWMKSLSVSGSVKMICNPTSMAVHGDNRKLWGQLDCTDLASTDSLISVSECLSRLFLRFSVFLLWFGERGVQVDPRSEPSLSWSSHYAGGHEVWPERRPRRNWTIEGERTDICQWGIGKRYMSTNISDIPLQQS